MMLDVAVAETKVVVVQQQETDRLTYLEPQATLCWLLKHRYIVDHCCIYTYNNFVQ